MHLFVIDKIACVAPGHSNTGSKHGVTEGVKNAKPLSEETNCVDRYAKTRNAGSLGEQEMRVMK